MTILMNKFKTLVISLLFTLVATNSLAEELSTTGLFVDGVVAIVNEGVVLKSELDRQTDLIILLATEAGMTLPPADVLQEQVLELLI